VLLQDLHHFSGLVDLALKNRGEIGSICCEQIVPDLCFFSFGYLKDFVI
jgi:hypothetical protein